MPPTDWRIEVVHVLFLAPSIIGAIPAVARASQNSASSQVWLWSALLGIGGSLVGGIVGGAFVLRAAGQQWREARRAADTAEEQTRIQRQLRIDAAQPYVWADMRPDDASRIIFNLVVGNSGPTVATDVHVKIDPPLPAIEQLKDDADSAQELLASGISSLPPGRTFTWALGQGFNLLNEQGRQAHTFTITAKGPFGEVPPLTYVLDLAERRGQQAQPGDTYLLTKAIRELANAIGQRTV
jgi:hypothetical protein